MTNRMPREGRLVLTPMLNEGGKLIGDFTIAKAAADRFLVWGSSQAQIYHMRWFEQHLPRDGSVRVRRFGLGLVGLSIAGPRSRELLAHLTDADGSVVALRLLQHRRPQRVNTAALLNRLTDRGD